MLESATNVAPSASLSTVRSFRPRILAAVAGVVALTLAASALAEPRNDSAQPPTGRHTTKARSHARAGRASHKAKHAVTTHRGKKGASLHSLSKTKAKGKVAAAGKSHRLNRGKHNTTKSAVASAHRGK